MTNQAGRGGLREQRKARTRRAIQEHALRLFLDQGYEQTTVEQIAAAAGVSHMTFFRYFPTKEAVVEDDDYDPLIADLIRARPTGESPLEALRAALRTGLDAVLDTDRDAVYTRTRLIVTTPALRARQWHNTAATGDLLAAALADRAGRPVDLRLRVIAAAATAALTTALTSWVEGEGSDDLRSLVDEAFAALAPEDAPED
ncbi:AcrR family transcriptional regulator [Saccharothrix coeruleofusca]|uniref:acyl-CoA-like ligand-binding transcription factor n=1 Tax=Saccharothrix coeruleofusca TaxID=33919 RepID=UPI001AE4A0B8|nr:TetR family transcriptional regulator [Saccharothrix coeruleofusca]MBP2334803.1 AcrR family transcriptional regulator [Saccharothrix coeruleofusca]